MDIGDTVNIASRLETATKELNCQLVVSETVAKAAEIGTGIGQVHEIDIRGRSDKLRVLAIGDASKLMQ